MKLLAVIPISKGINKETLSYFTNAEVEIGSVVKVPLRKKVIPGIVVGMNDVSEVKADIKNADFATRKIKKIKSSTLLSPAFMQTVDTAAQYFASTAGAILNSLIPKSILENTDKIKINIKNNSDSRAHEKLVIQSDDEERYANYKSIIREEFAKGYSVFFCLPTIQDIKKAYEKLAKGIEQYTFVLHGNLSKAEQIEAWNQASNEEHPILIVGTGPFLSLARHDLGTIIIDKENSRSYKNQTRPFVDIRTFAEKLAEKLKARIIFGDLLLRTETLYRQNNAELFEIGSLKFRSLTTSAQELVNMKEPLPDNTSSDKEGREPKFKLFSDSFLNLINTTSENDENMFIFVARRGLFPSTVCGDCGTIVICHSCGAPTVLHKSTKENFFLCHRCGERRSALEKCRDCQSWRLVTLGIGIEKVEEELKEKFPNLKIFKIDSDSATTHKKALDIASKFYSSPGSILLGTEMALLYLTEKIANTAVVSIDSFFSIPDFRINEKVLNILLKIRSLTSKKLLVQTRDINQKIFKNALQGNLADFYKEEIVERKTLDYPPFSTLIKITLSGEKRSVLAGMEKLQKDMSPFDMDVFPAFIPLTKGKFSMHALIKIKREEWVSLELLSKLKELSPAYTVNIDPESLL
ncbi:MAG: primosomal protein N' [Candidatus Paceibacterota bacterium]